MSFTEQNSVRDQTETSFESGVEWHMAETKKDEDLLYCRDPNCKYCNEPRQTSRERREAWEQAQKSEDDAVRIKEA